ncbi:transglutaminaseTgpA domain-containing protein [Polymorphospora sp. NPDC051019]|uniref:DUF3488 and transglutaminase-like domain-containing protein n=1 Tax=Polymorphospora sp. NPDC051019 TaxID=3155725 RepID=UPI0034192ADC
MVRWSRDLPVAVTLIAMIGLAGEALGRIYAGPLLTQLIWGAAAGSVAVGVAARRLPSWLVAPLSVAAMTGYTLLALRLAAGRADLPDPLGVLVADAVRNGIPRLLTSMIPVEAIPDTVIVPLVAAWLTGLAGTEVALRAARPLLGYLPPTLLYAGAVYVVGPNADQARWLTLAFAAAAVVGLAVTGRPAVSTPGRTGPPAASAPYGPAQPVAATGDDTPARTRAATRARAVAGSAAGAAVVVALAAAVAPVVATRVGGTPVDPRRYVQPPQVDSLDENPLIRISGWALEPEQLLFDVTTLDNGGAGPATDGAAADPDQPTPDEGTDDAGPAGAPTRIRLAVLSDYDGVTWRVGATYRNAGRILPPPTPNPDTTVDTVRQEITVADLTGRLLPAVPTPRQVDGARIAYDQDTGTLIHPDGLTPGLRYTVTSARERPDANLLSTADVPAGPAVARVLRVGDGTPDRMRRLADQLATDNGAPYDRALAIEEFLSTHYRLDADAPSGHAYPNLEFFLFGPRNAGGQRGTSEQFAASFAVLGRLTGLPTRVVVGFRSATGTGPVRGGDAYAWPEVYFTGPGWVAFDPLPRPDTQPRPVEQDFRPPPQEPTPPPTEEPEPTDTPGAEPSTEAAADRPRPGGLSGPLLASGGAGLLVVLAAGLAALVVLLRRAQRRRRLADGPPPQRIAGAWREVTDALRLAGRPAPPHLAATEVAAHAAAAATPPPVPDPPDTAADPAAAGKIRPPLPPLDDLANLVNRAAFAPEAASDDDARRAADRATAYTDTLRARQSWWRRLLWSLHPGPLRWRR